VIKLQDQEKKQNNFSGYIASALDEASNQKYPEKSFTEIEDQKEKSEMKPAIPTPTQPETPPEPTYQAPQPTKLEIPSAPVYPEYPAVPTLERIRKDEVEALVEQIIEEKWDTITAGIGDINLWKEKVRREIISIKQELLRLEHRFEEINKAVLGKVAEYDKNIKTVGTDIKAIEKVLKTILEPLTSNIKELQKLTTKLKK